MLLFTHHRDEVQVVIQDAGRGFSPPSIPPDIGGEDKGGRFGLNVMRERAESVGGSLEVRSAPEEGTRIIARLPTLIPAFDEKAARGARVLLVDDHPLYREGLHSLLASRGLHVVGEARDGLEAQAQAQTLRPDLILMDIHMPRCDGVEATRRIKAVLPDVKIVMLTIAADSDTLFEALKSGASGYLLKSLDSARFFSLLSQVMQGETVLSPGLASRVLEAFAQAEAKPVPPDGKIGPALTARQHEVLRLVIQDLSNKKIAEALFISERTVKYHVSQILERLQLRSRYELARYAQEQALAPPSPSDMTSNQRD